MLKGLLLLAVAESGVNVPQEPVAQPYVQFDVLPIRPKPLSVPLFAETEASVSVVMPVLFSLT